MGGSSLDGGNMIVSLGLFSHLGDTGPKSFPALEVTPTLQAAISLVSVGKTAQCVLMP